MIWEIVLFVIGYCFIAFLTTILFVYCERRIGETSADKIYKNYSDYALCGFLWVIILPIFLIALIYFGAKALTIFIVETFIAKQTIKEIEHEESHLDNSDMRDNQNNSEHVSTDDDVQE